MPAALELVAEQLIAVNLVPAKSTDVVPGSIRTLAVIAEPRLDTTSVTVWYLAVSPEQIDTIEYAYLEGQNGVYLETRLGFDVDGVEVKARLDFGEGDRLARLLSRSGCRWRLIPDSVPSAVVMFLLVPQVRLAPRLDVAAAVRRWRATLPDLIFAFTDR